jgi:tetrahydromethanopterin S-methyltransferase subunit G
MLSFVPNIVTLDRAAIAVMIEKTDEISALRTKIDEKLEKLETERSQFLGTIGRVSMLYSLIMLGCIWGAGKLNETSS